MHWIHFSWPLSLGSFIVSLDPKIHLCVCGYHKAAYKDMVKLMPHRNWILHSPITVNGAQTWHVCALAGGYHEATSPNGSSCMQQTSQKAFKGTLFRPWTILQLIDIFKLASNTSFSIKLNTPLKTHEFIDTRKSILWLENLYNSIKK